MPMREKIASLLFRLLPALCLLPMLAGCIDMAEAREEVRTSRRARFAAWEREAEGEADRPLLSGPISLSECVLIGLQHNNDVRIALEDRIQADARIQEAWSEALPVVELGASYTRLDRITRAGGVKVGSKNNYALTGSVRQPLWRGGAIGAGIRASRLFSALVDEQVRSTLQQVIFEIRQAYLDARLALELTEASRKSVELAAARLEDVMRNRDVGIAADFDVLRAQVQLKNFQAQLVQAENRYNLAVTRLLNVMNASQHSAIEPADSLEYLPAAPEMVEMVEAVEAAFLNNPDLLQQEYTVRVREELVTAEAADYWPDLDAVFSAVRSRPDPHNPARRNSWGTAWEAALTMTWPIFQGFGTVARVHQAKVELRKSRIRLEAVEEQILLDLRQAILSIQDAARFVESQIANIEQAEEALRLVRLGREQGVREEVEVLDAQTALDTARANYWQAVFDHEIARLNLRKATGALDPPEEYVPEEPEVNRLGPLLLP